VLAKRLVQQPGPDRQLASGDHDLDTLVPQDPEPSTRGVLARIVGGDDEPRYPGLSDRIGARRRLAAVAARFERHVQRRASEVATLRGADRLHLGVRSPESLVKSLPEHLVVAADHRADERVRADPPASALGELDRASEMAAIDLGGCGHGASLENRASGPPLNLPPVVPDRFGSTG
jgi:hypothetical protein